MVGIRRTHATRSVVSSPDAKTDKLTRRHRVRRLLQLRLRFKRWSQRGRCRGRRGLRTVALRTKSLTAGAVVDDCSGRACSRCADGEACGVTSDPNTCGTCAAGTWVVSELDETAMTAGFFSSIALAPSGFTTHDAPLPTARESFAMFDVWKAASGSKTRCRAREERSPFRSWQESDRLRAI